MTARAETRVADILDIFLQASTRPCLAVTESGEKWVMKLAGAGAGPRGLLTEFLAGRIARAMGAPVPDMRPLHLPVGFPWRVGTDEFDEMLQRSFGWNLGVAYIEGARPGTNHDLAEQEPSVLARIAASDRFLQNMDRTPRNPNLLVAPEGALWAIDYDACMFLDRALARRTPFSFDLPAGHLLVGLELPETGVEPPPDVLVEASREVPPTWLEGVGVSGEELLARLRAYARAAHESKFA